MLELRILNGAQALLLFDLPVLLGRKGAAKELGDQIETLIAFMDQLGGDCDLEEDDHPGGNITDENHDAEEDFGAEEGGETGGWPEQIDQSNLRLYADDDRDVDSEPLAYQHHRDRVRRTRCDRTTNPYAPFRVRSRPPQMVIGA